MTITYIPTPHARLYALAERLSALHEELLDIPGAPDTASQHLNDAVDAIHARAGDLEDESSYRGMAQARADRAWHAGRV